MVLLNTNTKAHNTRPNSSRDNRERLLIGYVACIVDCDKGQGDMHQCNAPMGGVRPDVGKGVDY